MKKFPLIFEAFVFSYFEGPGLQSKRFSFNEL